MSVELTAAAILAASNTRLSLISAFLTPVNRHMVNDNMVWMWFPFRAFGPRSCIDCNVPLENDEMGFYGGNTLSPSHWVCLECSYHRAIRAGVDVPEFPQEVI